MTGTIDMLGYQEILAKEWKYKKLPKEYSDTVRDLYLKHLPKGLCLDGEDSYEIRSTAGTLIAVGYDRIVIGDYGAFIEISPDRAIRENLMNKRGQEYRFKDPEYRKRVKYYWVTAKDHSDIKIYYQVRRVAYADYKPGMLYVSPHEIQI